MTTTTLELKPKENLKDGTYWSVIVWTSGVKKRCRKQSRETIYLGHLPFDENISDETIEALKGKAREAIRSTMKVFNNNAQMNLSRVTAEGISYKFLMFDEVNQEHRFTMQ